MLLPAAMWLAVSVHLKSRGVKNRCRLKDIPPHIKCIVAVPRMQLYIDCAAAIYGVFLKYLAPEDIYVYSIDESFLDVTGSLRYFGKSPKELADEIRRRVREEIGITISVGVSFCKVIAKLGSDYKKPDAITIIEP